MVVLTRIQSNHSLLSAKNNSLFLLLLLFYYYLLLLHFHLWISPSSSLTLSFSFLSFIHLFRWMLFQKWFHDDFHQIVATFSLTPPYLLLCNIIQSFYLCHSYSVWANVIFSLIIFTWFHIVYGSRTQNSCSTLSMCTLAKYLRSLHRHF